jgi:hypothetical protein
MLQATTYEGAFWEKSGRRDGTLRFPEYRTPDGARAVRATMTVVTPEAVGSK